MTLRDVLRSARRAARLSPMHRLMRRLRTRGVPLGELAALEVFGGTGALHTMDYASHVASLEAWERDPVRAEAFARNIPAARIRITDAYQAARSAPRQYGLVIVDNPLSIHGEHIEHFDFFPDIFGLLAPRAVLVVNVIPALTPRALRRFPYLASPAQREARARFYGSGTPDDIPPAAIVDTYCHLARAHDGPAVRWHLLVKRHFVYYLALYLERETRT